MRRISPNLFPFLYSNINKVWRLFVLFAARSFLSLIVSRLRKACPRLDTTDEASSHLSWTSGDSLILSLPVSKLEQFRYFKSDIRTLCAYEPTLPVCPFFDSPFPSLILSVFHGLLFPIFDSNRFFLKDREMIKRKNFFKSRKSSKTKIWCVDWWIKERSTLVSRPWLQDRGLR